MDALRGEEMLRWLSTEQHTFALFLIAKKMLLDRPKEIHIEYENVPPDMRVIKIFFEGKEEKTMCVPAPIN